MNYKLLTIILLGLMVFPLVNAGMTISEERECIKDPIALGDNATLSIDCYTCNYVNISSIQNPDGTTIILNSEMTKTGVTYEYNFTDTNQFGTYYFSVYGDKDGSVTDGTYCFKVTKTGTNSLPEGSSGVLIIAIIIMLLFGGTMFLLAYRVNNGAMVVILFGIGIIIIFMATLFSMSLIDNFLTEYTEIVEGYATYLLVFKILLSMSVLALSLYAGLRALKMYKIKRGFIDE